MDYRDREILRSFISGAEERELQSMGLFPFQEVAGDKIRLIRSKMPQCLDYLIAKSKENDIQQMHQRLSRAFFLFKWCMPDFALEQFDSILEEAIAKEHFELALEYLRLKRQVIRTHVVDRPAGDLKECVRKTKEVQALLNEHLEFIELHADLLVHIRNSLQLNKEQKAILKKDLGAQLKETYLQEDYETQSIRASLEYHACRSIIFHFIGEPEKQLTEHQNLVAKIESDPTLILHHQSLYTSAHHRIGMMALKMEKFELAKECVEVINGLECKDFSCKVSRFQSMIDVKMAYIHSCTDWRTTLAPFLEDLEHQYKEFGPAITHEYRLLYFFNVACSWFVLEDYEKTESFLENMPGDSLKKVRPDVWSFVELIRLACFYEQKNYRLLYSKAPGVYNKLRRSDYYPQIFNTLSTFFRRVNFAILDEEERRLKFAELEESLQQLCSSSEEDRMLCDSTLNWLAWTSKNAQKRG